MTTASPGPVVAPQTLVTGASGALGRALALRLAAPGTHLLLWGRDLARLEQTAALCRDAGSTTNLAAIDLADADMALAALAAADSARPIVQAMLVAGQGDSVPAELLAEPASQVLRLAQVNFAVPAALASALAQAMAARGHGHILLVGSAAGFHALPHAPAYAASKAGLARFAEALHIAMAPHGVQVTLVSPGFIDWPGGGRPVPSGLLLPLDVAADRIMAAFVAGARHAVIPRRFMLLHWLDRLLPPALRAALLRRIRP